ncbi:unnamed protein product [Didymodactylos carnosus]|uniref:Fe2OG dioxygenase domain-containing protein n=1 Tax=Didymodactylos carnosus TaxID=1234261 RepID=A0A813TEE4_9BILA|nr:unnamed protein product [Didymodactylos carnosus]CAF0807133.1 unnamed protein product [Didymodactylos carnosus]CAF3515167.1 unnamed protein product [Didymodactylos carnosus]CAF3592633.1 unnamed protein product [Didymodactylos carnosus]
MFELSKRYFHLPLEEKLKHQIQEKNHGYVRAGQENLDSTDQKSMDLKEAFNISRLTNEEDLPALFQENGNFRLVNQFQFDCYSLCMKLLKYLAIGFEIDEDYFLSRHKWDEDSSDIIRLLYYPSSSSLTTEKSIRAGAHSDYGSITLLFQHEEKGGLQVFDRVTKQWCDVKPYNEMIVVNTADALEYWTKGFVKSTVHRVIMPDQLSPDERYSIAYFCQPSNTVLLEPIPSKYMINRVFEKDEHAKHVLNHESDKILTAGEHLRLRLNKTYAY